MRKQTSDCSWTLESLESATRRWGCADATSVGRLQKKILNAIQNASMEANDIASWWLWPSRSFDLKEKLVHLLYVTSSYHALLFYFASAPLPSSAPHPALL